MPKLAVLVSGAGSILKAILEYPLKVDVVIADRKCPALFIAREAGIPVHICVRTFGPEFDDGKQRVHVTLDIVKILHDWDEKDVVAMAGFGTILEDVFFKKTPQPILLNTHPSLLPAFKGHRAVQRALKAGVKKTGCTVHIAELELDSGIILAQQEVLVEKGDTEETLHERIKKMERVLYPKTIAAVLAKLS